jgi:hypothetical protein
MQINGTDHRGLLLRADARAETRAVARGLIASGRGACKVAAHSAGFPAWLVTKST